MTTAGRFITIEGIEGVGKSTNVGFVADVLKAAGQQVIVTREPGGTPMAERIRALILETSGAELSMTGELLLMFAARAEHLEQLIRPQLGAGVTVVCDRFTDATFAYQGGGRGLPGEQIALLEKLVQQGLQPDLTLLLDAPPEVSAQRIAARDWRDRFEQEQQTFFSRVRQTYLERAAADPERFRIIDATQPLDAVQADIRCILEQFMNRN